MGKKVLQYNQANGTNYYLFHDNLNAPYCLHLMVTNAMDVMGAAAHFTQEQYQKGLEIWLWVVKSGLVLDAGKVRDSMGRALLTYKTGILYGNMGTTHYIQPPVFSDTTHFKLSNTAVMMNANSRHKEEAVHFLSCFFSPQAVGMEPIDTLGPWFREESRHYTQPGRKAISPENRQLWDVLIQKSVMSSLIGSIWQDLLFELYPALLEGRLTVPQFLQQAEHRANMMLGE